MKTKRRIRAISLFQDLLKQIKTAQDIAKQVDQLFNNLQEDLDEDLRLTEPLDHDELEKSLRKSSKDQSDVNISGSNTDKLNSKQISRIAGSRRVAVRLEEERFQDQRYGIPKLINLSKQFKPSSKRNKKEDCRRILKMYRIWSHKMFPKGSFGESIEQIEKLGHKRVIQNALKSWSEELSAKPKKKFNQMAPMEREKEVKVQKWKSDTENADKEVNRSKLELH
ncbi:replication fork protection component Swi3-domain-containing protein [Phakopsora pachyrhizi]|nr:replication fork protection component Swi3-domain-containing protein [Phakopsora pachyrhizi]